MSKIERLYILWGVFATIYLVLTLFVPVDPGILTRYSLTVTEARSLALTIAVPSILIWFMAFFGYAKIKNYSKLIKESNDGKALGNIAAGLLVLAVGLPVSTISNSALRYLGRDLPALVPLSPLVNLYLEIIIGVFAMTYIYSGARGLLKMLDKKPKSLPSYLVNISLTLVGISFIGLTLGKPVQLLAASSGGIPHIYISDFMLFSTIIVPLLYIWYSGLQAAYSIETYRNRVKGVLYKSALGYLASGLVFIILSRIALRYLTALSTFIMNLPLTGLLIIIYCLLVLMAIGYGLTASGAKRLKRLEEV